MFYINKQDAPAKNRLIRKYKKFLDDPKTRQQTIERLKYVRIVKQTLRERDFKKTEIEEIIMARLQATKKTIETNVAQGIIDAQDGSAQIQEIDRRLVFAKERRRHAWYWFDNDNAYIKGATELIEEYEAK